MGEPNRVSNRIAGMAFAFMVLAGLTMFGYRAGFAQSAWERIRTLIALEGKPLQASPPVLSQHVIAFIDNSPPQQQAEQLLEHALNGYQGALELIAKRVDNWHGLLNTDNNRLGTLLSSAYNANDLRVRAAAVEISLAHYNVDKTRASVDQQAELATPGHDGRLYAVWKLGLLGSRGIETGRVFQTLLLYTRDSDATVRRWAVEAIGLLGTDETVEPLLDIFHNDPSGVISERAACNLAQSGLLQQQQRLRAVPALLNFLQDAALEPQRKAWVGQALRDITGKDFALDATAWRTWYDGQRPSR